MKKCNVIKKLKMEGYWDNIPCVEIVTDKCIAYLALGSYNKTL